ncbi:uncharacterized protein LOC111831973 [Capsella rubella]|nr:uncharacterized protein LOC111831973 [Capsella rubella]
MTLWAIDFGMFGHKSVGQIWVRPIVDWVEYMQTGL